MKKLTLIALVFTLFLGMASSSTSVGAQSADPADVIQAAYAAVAEKDIDTAMTYAADDMVLTLIPPPPGMDGVFIGKEAVRAWWEGLTELNGRAEFSDVLVNGNQATWRAKWYADNFEAMGVGPAEFEGVSVAQNGLLKSATWVFTEEFQARLARANRLAANEQLATRYMQELWIEQNLDLLEELIHEDFVSYAFPEGDRDVLREAIIGFHADNPGGTFVVDETIVTEDHIMIRGGAVLTPEGADKPHRVDTWLISMHIRDGKIADRRIAFMPAAEDATVVTDASEIEGGWHVLGVDFDFYHKFYPDGTFHAAFSPDTFDDEPQAVGEYWIDDGQFYMKELAVVGIPPCGEEPVIYEAQLLASGKLQLALVEDACGPRINATNRLHAPIQQ